MKDLTLVTGAGGFIGGHLVRRLCSDGLVDGWVRAVDKKPLGQWHQLDPESESLCLDLSQWEDCRTACRGVGRVFHLACDMGGIGFIESNRIDCMRNSLIDTHMLKASYMAGADSFFFASSACVYPANLQDDPNVTPLKESDAYPAQSERGYGWEKLMTEMLCQEYWAECSFPTFIARFHNIYGSHGSWKDGREKAPAAICRKVIEAKALGKTAINLWGDGKRTRTFTYIDDCIEGILRLVRCPEAVARPVNIGSSELVTVDQLTDVVEEIAGTHLTRWYDTTAPAGVAGRSSDNTLIQQLLGWAPSTRLRDGMRVLYQWIESEYHKQKRNPSNV